MGLSALNLQQTQAVDSGNVKMTSGPRLVAVGWPRCSRQMSRQRGTFVDELKMCKSLISQRHECLTVPYRGILQMFGDTISHPSAHLGHSCNPTNLIRL